MLWYVAAHSHADHSEAFVQASWVLDTAEPISKIEIGLISHVNRRDRREGMLLGRDADIQQMASRI